jgi:hypothetical protein
MKANSAVVSSISLALFLPVAASANLLSGGNWDFESPDVPGAPNAWVTYAPGSTIGNWTVIGTGGVNVAHVNENTLWPGNTSQFLDLTGLTGGGGIAWYNIATVVGLQYEASWSAFNFSVAQTDDLFTFQATGGSVVAYDLAPGTGATFTYAFTASSGLTTITFMENTFSDSNAGWIDNVQMVLIPEPGTLSLAGLSAVLFAGWFGFRRRST